MCSEEFESESDVTVWLSLSKVVSGDFAPIELLLDLPAAFGLTLLILATLGLVRLSWVVGKINDLVWPFLWGSRIQTVNRQSCFQPAVRGGLNMVVFSFKAQALKLASIIGVCNSGCKAFFMFKYFFWF